MSIRKKHLLAQLDESCYDLSGLNGVNEVIK